MARRLAASSRLRLPDAWRHPGQVSPGLIWLALGAVYVIWGSTYTAIREAVLTLPPLFMASVRFLVAGGVLYAWAIRRGDRQGDRPGWPEWRSAFIVGCLLLLVGNGGVVLAERSVPSGIAALVIATIPLWMAVIDRMFFGQRLAPQAIAGLVLGFAGLAVLVGGTGRGRLDPVGMAILLTAAVGWSIGSMYSRNARLPARPLVATAMEMLAGGVSLAIAGAVHGELGRIHPERFSTASLLGLAYLIVFGSWVAFSAYIWLLRSAPISLVSTYAYVNPVVAALLGWLLLSEWITARTLVAGAVILVAVALILSARKIPPGEPADAAPDAASLGGQGRR
ncbi:MAG TPA: EamA family transporter [Actinomycetota bacterium]|jgi:drug/metabolite transporter (DMT)-like permease